MLGFVRSSEAGYEMIDRDAAETGIACGKNVSVGPSVAFAAAGWYDCANVNRSE